MSGDVDALKNLLTELRGEINLGEEKLNSKMNEADYLREKEVLKADFYRALKAVDDRINGLYIKVAAFSSIIVGIIEVVARNS